MGQRLQAEIQIITPEPMQILRKCEVLTKLEVYRRESHVQARLGSFEIADSSKRKESPHSVAELL